MIESEQLAAHYGLQTDEELLRLKEESEQLTPAAREQLNNELQRRRIGAAAKQALRVSDEIDTGDDTAAKFSILFPSLGRVAATLKDWRHYRSQTGAWPVFSIAAHVIHGVFLVGWAGYLVWFGVTHKWSTTKLVLVSLPLLLIDTILENWIEGKIRTGELQRYRTKRSK